MPNYLSPGVYVEEVDRGSRPIEGAGTAVAAFVGVTERGPVNQPTLVTNWGQYTSSFGDFVAGTYTALAVNQYFQNGGGSCYVVRIGSNGSASGDGEVPGASAELTSGTQAGLATYRVEAVEAGDAGNDLSVEVIPDEPQPSDDADAPQVGPPEAFTLLVKRRGDLIERFENLTTRRGRQHVETIVNERSEAIRITELGSATVADRLPAAGEVRLSGGLAPAVSEALASEDFIGDEAARTGLGGLTALENVTMVACPDIMAAYEQGLIDLEGVQVAQTALIDHCELMGDRVAILDTPGDMNAQEVKEWRVERTRYDSKFATMYWPYIKAFDPALGTTRYVPPSGAIAGIWGRNDDTRGVHKAPANEVVRGAIDIAVNITRGEHDQLNPEGINVIRAFPGRGIRVWGARTLSSDPAWRYLNVRRLFNYLETSILNGTQWVVFEPNDMDLWQRVKRTINAFLLGAWRDGALFGATPGEAYYVKCDAETNPPDVVDRGQLIVEIGVAPVKPAEFVVFRLSQYSGGAAVVE
jgi:uncharacterized protein